MLIYGADRELKLWAGERLGIQDFGPTVTIGVTRAGKLAAVALFNNYHPPNIMITFVTSSPRWASKEAICGILQYPFIQLGCKRLTAVTEVTNEPARAFLHRLGFKQEGYHPDWFTSGDGVSYGLMAKDAARWIAAAEDKINALQAA